MGARTCKKCGQLRARPGEDICPVCWLVAELAREHRAGEHKERTNASCVACTRAPKPRQPNAHAECEHDATPAERRKCRKRRQEEASA